MVRMKKSGGLEPHASMRIFPKVPPKEKTIEVERVAPIKPTPPTRVTDNYSLSPKRAENQTPPKPTTMLDPKHEAEFASVYDISKHHIDANQGSSRGIWFLALLCVLTLIFALSWFFSEAKVTINPKVLDVALDKNFFSAKGALTSDLAFDLIVVSGEAKREVVGAEKREVEESAKGRVIIYNNYSSATQRLDINTRLEGSNGKIYKTEKQIVVPGKKSDGTPGSIEVNVYASLPGESYNSGPLDFTIFGFKGTPKYSKFYARSKSDMAGGKVGTVNSVAPEVETQIINELKTSLQEELLQKASGSIPAGFILFHGATSLSIDSQEINPVPEKEGTAEIKITGSLHGFLFDEASLIEKIAAVSVEGYDGSEVMIPNLRDLNFTIYDQDALSFKDTKNLTFNLSGETKIVYKVDENKLLADLVGRSKKDINQILSDYPNVVSGNVTLKPFWRNSLPEKPKDVKLIINYP